MHDSLKHVNIDHRLKNYYTSLAIYSANNTCRIKSQITEFLYSFNAEFSISVTRYVFVSLRQVLSVISAHCCLYNGPPVRTICRIHQDLRKSTFSVLTVHFNSRAIWFLARITFFKYITPQNWKNQLTNTYIACIQHVKTLLIQTLKYKYFGSGQLDEVFLLYLLYALPANAM